MPEVKLELSPVVARRLAAAAKKAGLSRQELVRRAMLDELRRREEMKKPRG